MGAGYRRAGVTSLPEPVHSSTPTERAHAIVVPVPIVITTVIVVVAIGRPALVPGRVALAAPAGAAPVSALRRRTIPA